jgi:hypothetical protein
VVDPNPFEAGGKKEKILIGRYEGYEWLPYAFCIERAGMVRKSGRNFSLNTRRKVLLEADTVLFSTERTKMGSGSVLGCRKRNKYRSM